MQFSVSLMLVIGFLLLFSMMGCSYPLDENTTVYGNCGDLYRYSLKVDRVNNFFTFNISEVKSVPECPKITCPPVTQCPVCVEKTCIENITPSPQCFCKECPQQGTMSQVVSKQLLNLKPGANGNPAISHGYFLCKADVLELTGLKGSKFNEGPAVSGYKDFYDSQGISHPDNVTYCFRDIAGYFIVNRSIWGWNDSQCLSSSLKITKMD